MEKQEIKALLDELELSVSFTFVPWSASRSAKPTPKLDDYNLNYKATLTRKGVPITLVDYSMGQAFCPSYVQRIGRVSVDEAHTIIKECETGKSLKRPSISAHGSFGVPILPDPVALWYSIISECDVLQYSTFEAWARDLGFDPDSRKGEAIYRQCLQTALAVSNAIGSAGLERLREAYQDY